MKKVIIITLAAALLATLAVVPVMAAQGGPKAGCTTIQSGELLDSKGNPLTVGYDQWGYNYQAHMFCGYYDNYSRPDVPVTEGDGLIMWWNDAWLSNMDCDGDSLLDRHSGHTSYDGSGAWLTNHIFWTDEEGNQYSYFCKIITPNTDAGDHITNGVWYTIDDEEIGPVIWGAFAITQEIEQGVFYQTPSPVGLGYYGP